MNDLTSKELQTLNQLSAQRDPAVSLGTLLNTIISSLGKAATPVNAVAATKDLTFSGVVVDGQTITFNNPAISGSDVYEFLADTAQTKTAPGNIAVNIEANAAKASVTVPITVQPVSGDILTVGTKAYTFVPVGTANGDGEISIGADVAAARANAIAAINGTDGVNTPNTVARASANANAVDITAIVGGTAGNSIPCTYQIYGGALNNVPLTGGTDCTATNAAIALLSAMAGDTQGVSATRESAVLHLSAKTKGIAGNAITLAKTAANAAFAGGATTLSGGVNGTVTKAGAIVVDADYMYVAIADNTISDANWRRVSLGSVF